VTFFNSSSNWGTGAGQIGPGVTVDLCGTISSALGFHGSGTSGNPITLYWQPGATMSSGDWGGGAAIKSNGSSYITLNGGNNGTSIQATAEGTGLADQGVASQGIIATNCTGCTIENLTIANLYVHSSPSDTSVDQTQDNAIRFSGSSMTIQNNTIHDVGWALYEIANSTDSNITIANNNIYNIDHGWASTAAFNGGNIGPIVFSGNHVHDFSNWDTTNDAYHHDGIHCYSANAQGLTPHYNGVYIYDNRFDGGNGGANMTADIFLEGGSGSGSTPCSDNTSNFYLFNNVFVGSAGIYNGLVGLENNSMGVRAYNNTLEGSGTSSGVCEYDPASTVTFENNVMSACGTLIQKNSNSAFTTSSPDYDVYASGGSNSFICNGNYYSSSGFNNWKNCTGGDTHGTYVSSASLNSNGSPQTGSPVLAAGTNLTNLCTGNLTALCTNINGTPRPTTGPWNAGAY
jgi:hypothetical protein